MTVTLLFVGVASLDAFSRRALPLDELGKIGVVYNKGDDVVGLVRHLV